ncbi:hypothetical protein [Mastigocoleus testarum]|uniref:Uncharacterized protein n=1 Tax=Mastigocoleus testarum BC008 TaxID=371196 RepID=A0A0V8A0D9_9CYAN|nr:hypothetical protein [Mastigocoleus testarum]KST66895.1 hypothetical protein BC008_27295 [Mastigocoleus testarum BC008]KST70233.1 hypothetical protein BC008_36900 [Mastigocoleus testarum BC008]
MSHSQVEIYVRSSPLGEVGIHWRNISKPEQPKEEPDVLKQKVIERNDGKQVTINSPINDTKPFLILARYQNKVLLELTGLDAAEARSRKMGRRISEIVLWVGDDSPETESQLRKLAACALLSFWSKESTFLSAIRSSIDFDGLNGFKVNTQQIEELYADANTHLDRLLSKVSPKVVNISESVWSTPKTIDIESELYNLVNQINQTSLPETKQPVVVVTEFKQESDRQQIIYKGNIWVEKKRPPAPIPEPVPTPKPVPPPEPVPTPKPAAKIRLVILRIILPILIALAILLITQSPVLTPTHSPKLTPTLTPTPILNPQPVKTPLSPDNQPQSYQIQSPDA